MALADKDASNCGDWVDVSCGRCEAMTSLISCSQFTRRDEAAIATRSVEQSSRVAQAGEAPEMLLRLEAGSASDACRQNLVSWTSRPAR